MKNLLLFFFLFIFKATAFSQESRLLELSITGIKKEQSLLELTLVELMIINTQNKVIQITDRGHWYMQATIGGRYIPFSEGETSSAHPMPFNMGPGDTLRIRYVLNLFNLASSLRLEKFDDIDTKINIRIKCYTDNVVYYSEPFNIRIIGLSALDFSAFKYLKSLDYNPYKFTKGSFLRGTDYDQGMVDSIIAQFPESTFSTLGQLSRAHYLSINTNMDVENYNKISDLLKPSLVSESSYIRYLAEELNKKQ